MTTYLSAVNDVLARLREASVVTVAQNSYGSLVGKELSHYVYAHIRKDSREVFYIGKGSGWRLTASSKRNKYWLNIVAKAGGFYPVVLISGLNSDDAYEIERLVISEIRKKTNIVLCNLIDGGKGGSFNPSKEVREKQRLAKLGCKLSDEHKKKIGAAHKGMKRSDECKRKQSLAAIGRIKSKEHIEKIRLSRIGTKASGETKIKMSLARRGELHPMYGKKQTAEAIEKTRMANIGRIPWNKGKLHTESHRKALKSAWIIRKIRKEINYDLSAIG